jgi:hypothetical protein
MAGVSPARSEPRAGARINLIFSHLRRRRNGKFAYAEIGRFQWYLDVVGERGKPHPLYDGWMSAALYRFFRGHCAVDADGNELAGIRFSQIAVPLGNHRVEHLSRAAQRARRSRRLVHRLRPDQGGARSGLVTRARRSKSAMAAAKRTSPRSRRRPRLWSPSACYCPPTPPPSQGGKKNRRPVLSDGRNTKFSIRDP